MRYDRNAEIDGYSEKGNSSAVVAGYKFLSNINTGVQLHYQDSSYYVLQPHISVPESYRFSKIGWYVDYDQSAFHFYFQEGHKLRVQVGTQITRNDDAENVANGEISYGWQSAIYHDHALQLHLRSRVIDSKDARDSYKLGGNSGFRGIEPGSVWVREAHSLSVEYKVPIVNIRAGVWTIGPFVDYASFKPFDSDEMTDSLSWGAAAFMFLKGITLPGVGVIVGRNEDYLGSFVSLTIGFGWN